MNVSQNVSLPKVGVRFALALCLLGLTHQFALAQASVIDQLVGTWKENEAKHKSNSQAHLRFRVDAKGGLEETRGSDAHPLVQPIRFEGKAYAIDGSKNTIAWKQFGTNRFESGRT